MRAVGVAVIDRSEHRFRAGEAFHHPGRDGGGPEGDVARGDALGKAPQISLHAPQPRTEHVAGAPEAGDHLVGDQQHAVAVADFTYPRPVVRRRHDDAAGALDRLGDECGNRVGALKDDLALEQLGTDPAELFAVLRVRIAIQPWRVDVEAPRQQRLVGAPKRGVAVDAHPAEVHAVIALAQRDELGAIALAAHLPVLTRQLQGALDGVRAAAAEVHGADTVGRHQPHQALRQLDGTRMRRAAKGVVEGQLVELRHDRVADFLAAEAEVRAPQPADAVDQPVSVDVPDPAALAPRDDVGGRLTHRARMRHRVQQVQGVFRLQFLGREFAHDRTIVHQFRARTAYGRAGSGHIPARRSACARRRRSHDVNQRELACAAFG